MKNKNENKVQKRSDFAAKQEGPAFVEEVISIRRVAKVIKGGRRLMFSAFVVSGDENGRVGVGLGKGREVAPAVSKAFKRAKKNLLEVPLKDATVPFEIMAKFGASKVLLRPAKKGTGMIAGGAVRQILGALGIKDILAKSIGSSNSVNVSYATLKALKSLKNIASVKEAVGLSRN